MYCPNCNKEIIFKEDESTAVCENCGCVLTISVSMEMPPENEKIPAPVSETKEENETQNEAGAREDDLAPVKKQLNVFGPAALALGILTAVFAFLSGLKALVLGIPALIVGGLGIMTCVLLKNAKKRLSVAGLILSAAGIIIAVILRSGYVF